MNVNSLPRVLYLKTCENPNNNILQSEYLDKHENTSLVQGVLRRFAEAPCLCGFVNLKRGPWLLEFCMWSPEMRLFCPGLIVNMLCWESGGTKTMHVICLCKSAE